MEKRRFMKDNKGYTLIEMIIVIAIIAIMTGAAMVTITILHNAKAKEASITLETALSEKCQRENVCGSGYTAARLQICISCL